MHDKIYSSKIVYHTFIIDFNLKRLVNLLVNESSSKNIDNFKETMFYVYRKAAREQIDKNDKKQLSQFLLLLNEYVDKNSDGMDKIKLLQLSYLCSNIHSFIDKLS